MLKGYVDELFVSVQGEGLLVGTPMLFIRFGGCSAACEHCDTPRARTQLSQFTVHGFSDATFANPVKAAIISEHALPLLRTLPYVAITGGEPLEQIAFLHLLLDSLGGSGKKVLLDTRGYHYRELEEVVSRVDVVSADVKLPSFSGRPWAEEETRKFLQIAQEKSCYVKVVAGGDTPESEIETAARLVADVNPCIPFILQPRWNGAPTPPADVQRLIQSAIRVSSILEDVRVVPQIHRVLGVK